MQTGNPEKTQLNVAIVSHVMIGGLVYDVVEYLRLKSPYLVFIGHPLNNEPGEISFCRCYQDGQLLKELTSRRYKLPNLLKYLQDILLTLWWLGKDPHNFDLYIGLDILNAFAGVGLRVIKHVKRTVLWTIDYVPKRFHNYLMNRFYHWGDDFCLSYVDCTWNLSPRMAEGRARRRGLITDKYPRQFIVPHGIALNQIHHRPFEEIDRYAIAFMGNILKKSGVQLVIDALPLIQKTVPQAHLIIIGSGPYESELKSRIIQLGLEGCIEFSGYIEDHRIMEDKLAQCAVGVAIYNPALDDFTYYSDPGKVKTYLGVGMPVIITDVPWIAQDLNKKKCGILVQYDVDDVVNALVSLLSNENLLREYRMNALQYAKYYEYSRVMDRALVQTMGSAWESDIAESIAQRKETP